MQSIPKHRIGSPPHEEWVEPKFPRHRIHVTIEFLIQLLPTPSKLSTWHSDTCKKGFKSTFSQRKFSSFTILLYPGNPGFPTGALLPANKVSPPNLVTSAPPVRMARGITIDFAQDQVRT